MITELPLKEKISDANEYKTSVCFVCSGNTCRSPMAAAVLSHLGKGAYMTASAGLCAVAGEPISKGSVKALEKAGIENTPENNYESHKAIETSEEYLERFDKIVAISRSHELNLICAYPALAGKITVMPRDIPDPFMQGQQIYDTCLKAITEGIKELFAL